MTLAFFTALGRDARTLSLLLAAALLFAAAVPRARRRVRQTWAVAVLSLREGLRQKVFWTAAFLLLFPALIAWAAEADGTYAGRMRVVTTTCLGCGEALGAAVIVLLAAFSVAGEIESRVMNAFGVKPLPRYVLLLGKACGFFGVQVLFLLYTGLCTYVLVRGELWREPTRKPEVLQKAAEDWPELERRTLTTHRFRPAEPLPPAAASVVVSAIGGENSTRKTGKKKKKLGGVLLRPGESRTWRAPLPPETGTDGAVVRLKFFSGVMSASNLVADLTVNTVPARRAGPLYVRRGAKLPQGRPADLFFDAAQLRGARALEVTIGTPKSGTSPFAVFRRKKMRAGPLFVPGGKGVLLGVPRDGFVVNLGKALFLTAVRGFVLALAVSAWSGVLSFPVLVALGCLLILGGELSRYAIDLLGAIERRRRETAVVTGGVGAPGELFAPVKFILRLFPDFRAGGGPAAFVDGRVLRWNTLAEVLLWTGLARGVGWALPGFLLFQRREVGK